MRRPCKVRELLADLDKTAEIMAKTLHRDVPSGEPEAHPFIKTAVRGYASMHDRFRTSVQGTARSYLKWLAGAVEHALSASDVSLGELMCADHPVSLYVQVAPADAAALRPLVRLFFYAAAQALTAHETQDASGRPKRHTLLMVTLRALVRGHEQSVGGNLEGLRELLQLSMEMLEPARSTWPMKVRFRPASWARAS